MNKKIPILGGSVPNETDPLGKAGCRRDRLELVDSLRATMQQMVQDHRSREEALVSSGCAALDQLLPDGGWRRGRLVEWFAGAAGSGAGTLTLILARQAALEGGVVVVLDRQRQFYPPAAAALGVDLEKLIVVRTCRPADEVWALDQILRCPGVAAVWAPLERLPPRAFRRLQLSAESGGCLGLLLRPGCVRGQPSWAHWQLSVEPSESRRIRGAGAPGETEAPGGLRRVRVERTRGRQAAHQDGDGRRPVVELEIDETCGRVRSTSSGHETHPLPLAAPLAHPAALRRSARA